MEHPIGVIQRVFGFQKVRYRGLSKNLNRLEATAAMGDIGRGVSEIWGRGVKTMKSAHQGCRTEAPNPFGIILPCFRPLEPQFPQ